MRYLSIPLLLINLIFSGFLFSQSVINTLPALVENGEMRCLGGVDIIIDPAEIPLPSDSPVLPEPVLWFVLDRLAEAGDGSTVTPQFRNGKVENFRLQIEKLPPDEYLIRFSYELCNLELQFEIGTEETGSIDLSPGRTEFGCLIYDLIFDHNNLTSPAGSYGCTYFERERGKEEFLGLDWMTDTGSGWIIADPNGGPLKAGIYQAEYSLSREGRDCSGGTRIIAKYEVVCCAPQQAPAISRVTEPSSCTSADGSFTLLPYPSSHNFGQIDWYVENAAGEFWEIPPGGYLAGLSAGTYTIVGESATADDGEDACTVPTREFVLGGDAGYNFFVEQETATCANNAVGTVEIEIWGPPDAEIIESTASTYTFEQVAVEPDGTTYRYFADGLGIGEVCITVARDGADCPSKFCHEMREVEPGVPRTPYAEVENDCANGGQGRIALYDVPFAGTYTIVWDNGTEGRFLNSLTAGTYCYTLTTVCGDQVQDCVNVLDPSTNWQYELEPVECSGSTRGDGRVDLSVHKIRTTAGTPPQRIHYPAYGSLTHENPNAVAVFGSEASPCNRYINESIARREVDVQWIQPCGNSDGGVVATLWTESSDIEVTLNGNPVQPMSVAANTLQVSVDGLVAGVHRLEVSIDGCQHLFTGPLHEGEGIEKVYVDYNEDTELCEYDQYCRGEFIDAPLFEFPSTRVKLEPWQWFNNCATSVHCDERSKAVDYESYPTKMVSKIVYQLLYAIAERAQAPYLKPREVINAGRYDFFSQKDLCAGIRYCPLDMGPNGRISLMPGNGSNTVYDETTGCIKTSCGFGRELCDLTDFLPPGVIVRENDIIQILEEFHCEYRSLSIGELIMWHSDLMLVDGYAGSTLAQEAERLRDLYGSGAPAYGIYCARVSYCAGTFEHLFTAEIDNLLYCGRSIPPGDQICGITKYCEHCETTDSEGCVKIISLCPTIGHDPATTPTPDFAYVHTSSCYPGDEYFQLTVDPTVEEQVSAINFIDIPKYYSPHRPVKWIQNRMPSGALSLPGSFLESPFIPTVDLSPYRERVTTDDYDGLLHLSFSEDDERFGTAVQQVTPEEVQLEFSKAVVNPVLGTLSATAKPVDVLNIADSGDQLFLEVSTDGPLYYNDSLVQNGSAASTLLIYDLQTATLESANSANSLNGRLSTVKQGKAVARLESAPNASTDLTLWENGQVNTYSYPNQVDNVHISQSGEVALASVLLGNSTELVLSLGLGQTLATVYFDDTQPLRLSSPVTNSYWSITEQDGNQYLVLYGFQSLEYYAATSPLDSAGIYLLDLKTREVSQLSVLRNADLVGVYSTTVEGVLPVQILAHPSSEQEQFFEIGDVWGVNQSAFVQTVTTGLVLNRSSSGLQPRSEDKEINVSSSLPQQIEVFPNPTTGLLSVKGFAGDERVDVQVVAPDGRLLQQTTLYPTGGPLYTLDLVDIPTGIYTLNFHVHAAQGTSYQVRKRVVMSRK